MKLTRAHRRFLAAMYPAGSVAVGTEIGLDLFYADLVEIDRRRGRYQLSATGRAEIEKHPESKWNLNHDGRAGQRR